MIDLDRRTALRSLSAAGVLAPFLAIEQAMAQQAGNGGHASSGDPTQEEMMAMHEPKMKALFGDNLFKVEHVAMLL